MAEGDHIGGDGRAKLRITQCLLCGQLSVGGSQCLHCSPERLDLDRSWIIVDGKKHYGPREDYEWPTEIEVSE